MRKLKHPMQNVSLFNCSTRLLKRTNIRYKLLLTTMLKTSKDSLQALKSTA